FARTGERTPIVGPDDVRLTSTGAQQAFSLGQQFRDRYVVNNDSNSNAFAPINNLNTNRADREETVILVPDNEYFQGSAQAFMQSFYPPHKPEVEEITDLSQILSDSSVVDNPLNGYIYPLIHTSSDLDPNSIFVAGADNCVTWAVSGSEYLGDPQFLATQNATVNLYDMIGIDVLASLFPEGSWGYYNAYAIYDYVRYQYVHNSTVFKMFNDTASLAVLSELRWLADQHEWALNGDQSPSGITEGDKIRTIGGQTLAAKILGFLQNVSFLNVDHNVATSGATNKLNLMVGEYDVMLALFSLLSLPEINPDFMGLPDFGSALVFELFDLTANSTYPNSEDLWVRFYFQNGTSYGPGLPTDSPDDSRDYQAYPMFGLGPSQTSMPWADFEVAMDQIMLSDVGGWCDACSAFSVFCAAYTSDDSSSALDSSGSGSHSNMSPQVAGVIGAAVTLGVTLIAALLLLLFGVRFRRQQNAWSKKPSDLGGFKGSAKLASDQDLTLPKNGAPMGKGGATVQSEAVGVAGAARGHERVGSWELKEPSSPRSIGES
ncbi:phosphoglycerate mutase-like protein, partial [Rhizodiscina lignyota]